MTAKRLSIALLTARILCSTTGAQAADGPENTGSLILELPNQSTQSATLQLDRNVLVTIFGDDTTATNVTRLIHMQTSGGECAPQTPSTVDAANVVTALLSYECDGAFSKLTISLANEVLPPGFTLGVRTPFDHFVLSESNRTTTTTTSGLQVFFRAGLQYLTGGSYLAKAFIARAHALYFGGLQHIPPGIWMLLFVLAIWSTAFSFLTKLVISCGMIVGVAVIAAFVISKDASIALIPVRTLSFLSLASIMGLTIAGKLPKRFAKFSVPFLIVATTVLNGLEHAVILRWLEGQTNINPWQHVAAFFLGTLIVLTALLITGASTTKIGSKASKVPETKQAPKILALVILFCCAYATVALAFKIS